MRISTARRAARSATGVNAAAAAWRSRGAPFKRGGVQGPRRAMTSDNHESAARLPSAWPGFAVMGVGMFMAILDIQVVATSIPTIQKALAVRPDAISWVQTAYLIAEVVAIPLTGLLTRLLSMRWLFVTAITVFTLASLGCALSGGFGQLIAWRVLQG